MNEAETRAAFKRLRDALDAMPKANGKPDPAEEALFVAAMDLAEGLAVNLARLTTPK